jgi:hypothetical protein
LIGKFKMVAGDVISIGAGYGGHVHSNNKYNLVTYHFKIKNIHFIFV